MQGRRYTRAAIALLCLWAALTSAETPSGDEFLGERTPMHTMWGADDVQNTWEHQPPKGLKLVTSQDEIKRAFGIEDDYTDVSKEVRLDAKEFNTVGNKYFSSLWTMFGSNGHDSAKGGKQKSQSLSHINQPEMGVNPEGQACPDYGLDRTNYIVAGKTMHYWRKTVEIRDPNGEILSTIKRGCPAWTNSFVWQVPLEHASGCRDGVDPSIFSDKCQMPETEILYTDQWTGLLQLSPTRVMDCHDDIIFKIYEVKRDVILSGYMMHSDFVVENKEGEVMGYCRLEGFDGSVTQVGSHNFSFVNLDGDEVARAERPLHWENGAEEHAWNVTIIAPVELDTLTDPRVILVAVANGVMLAEETDWCSDLVFMMTPVMITLSVIGITAAVSAVVGYYGSPNRGKLSDSSPLKEKRKV